MPPKAFGRSPPPPKRTSTQTATPDTSERRLSHSGTIVFIVLLVARQLSLYNFEVPYTTADAATPLVVERTDIFSDDARKKLLDAAFRHPASRKQALSEHFKRTRGFVLQFNDAGAARLRDSGDFGFLAPFFDAMHDNEANAFVLNVLIVPPSPASERAPAVGLHRDNTVGVSSARVFVAHSVSVFYLQVPPGMRGGELNLYAEAPDDQEGGDGYPPDAVVRPTQGATANFRGDAYHKVNRWWYAGHAADEDDEEVFDEEEDMRVSLVLEQYRLPESAAAHTTEFALIRDDHRSYQAIAQATLFTFNQLGSLFVALCIGFLTLSSLRERGAPASA